MVRNLRDGQFLVPEQARNLDVRKAVYPVVCRKAARLLGAKYGKTAAQVALKWNAQRGVSIIPKSVHKERMEQNIDIWDFVLSDADMKQIDALDLGHSEIIDHNDPAIVKYILSAKAE